MKTRTHVNATPTFPNCLIAPADDRAFRNRIDDSSRG